jgi:hypothetical protein
MRCEEILERRVANGKRTISVGMLRPDIVLYGEHHKQGVEIMMVGESIAQFQNKDVRKNPDLVLVLGTSLKIPGLKNLLKSFSNALVLFLNLTAPPRDMESFIDYHFQGECDDLTVILSGQSSRPSSSRSVGKKLAVPVNQRRITELFQITKVANTDKEKEKIKDDKDKSKIIIPETVVRNSLKERQANSLYTSNTVKDTGNIFLDH